MLSRLTRRWVVGGAKKMQRNAPRRDFATNQLRYRCLPSTSSIFVAPSRSHHICHSRIMCNGMGESNGTSVKKTFERLPTNVSPVHYDIRLIPDLASFTFAGESTVNIKIAEATSTIKLHAKEVDVSTAVVTVGGKELILTVEMDSAMETMTLKSAEELPVGEATLRLVFNGVHNDKMRGFYRSTYKGKDGTDQIMVSTQFESTSARYAFPCWDEPMLKATFDIKLVVKDGLTALSNGIVTETKSLGNGTTEYTYSRTPIMSSYILAFAVGKFGYIEDKTKNDTIVRVYAVNGNEEQGKFALDCARRALDYYDEFFDIKYPLPKCDLIAVPDFAMGAMENWGLVTYREVALLVDPATTSTQSKQYVALVVAHELAHMWFGNLVTMKWWTDLWLKEGFATFMEYLFVSLAYPEFKIWMRFASDEIGRGLSLDALHNSHPIEVQIENPNEIDEIYDGISYSKGASLNGMCYDYLGHETFRAGLQTYLKTYQYSNAVTNDLWSALGKASGQDVNELMSTWTQKMGFPVVQADYDMATKTLTLSQKRFLADGSDDNNTHLWHVPISIGSKSSKNQVVQKVLLKEKKQSFVLDKVADGDWVKLNSGMKGYYRVKYSKEMLDALLPSVANQTLSSVDRYNLLTDVFALVRAGQMPATSYLDVVRQCTQEEDLLVWETIDGAIGALVNVLRRSGEKDAIVNMNKFIQSVYAPIMGKLTYSPIAGESVQSSTLRGRIMQRLGRSDHQPTIDAARNMFQSGKQLVPDLRRAVYLVVAGHDGTKGIEELIKVYESSESPEVKRHCLVALGTTLTEHEKVLDYAMNSGKVRSQDCIYTFMGCTMSKEGQDMLWPYFKNNYDAILKKYGGAANSLFLHTMQCSCESTADIKMAGDVKEFITAKEAAATLNRPMEQSVESIKLNANLLAKNEKELCAYLIK